MNDKPDPRTGVAALRPWPFGPPLRGRAPHRHAGPRLAPRTAVPPGPTPRPPASAAGLTSASPLGCVL
jgi:hypothetical protein